MKQFVTVLVIIVFIYQADANTVTQINLQVDPIVINDIGPDPSTDYASYIRMPFRNSITLSPGDDLHIDMHFTDNKMLQIANSPVMINFYLILSAWDPWPEYGRLIKTIGGSTSIDINRSQGLPINHFDGQIWSWSDRDEYLLAEKWFEVADGALIGDFSFDFKMPFSNLSTPPAQFETTTFINNEIMISTNMMANLPGPYLYVVPEPCTLLLLGLGAAVLSTRKNFSRKIQTTSATFPEAGNTTRRQAAGSARP